MSSLFNLRFILISFAILVISPLPGNAITFNVNTTVDGVDANIGDGVCATAGGACSLRAAIQEANHTAALDIVNLPNGTYTLSIFGTSDDQSATGDLDVLNPIVINGTSKGNTIIDGLYADGVFEVYNPGSIKLNDLTIQNGSGPTAGAVYHDNNQSLELTNVKFYENFGGSVGAIYAVGPVVAKNTTFMRNASTGSYADLYISTGPGTCTFSDSTFSSGAGAAIYISGDCTTTVTKTSFKNYRSDGSGIIYHSTGSHKLTISDVVFEKNTTQGGSVIYYSGSSDVDITDTDFIRNSGPSSSSGAVYISTGSGDLNLKDVNFMYSNWSDGNADVYYSGGGDCNFENMTSVEPQINSGSSASIYCSGSGAANLKNVSIDGAFCNSCGSGTMEISVSGSVIIENSSFTNGRVSSGSAAGAYISCGGEATVTGTTFAGNTVYDGGTVGALYISSSGNATLSKSSLFDNRAGFFSTAGGYYCSSGALCVIENTTFSNNIGYNVGGYYASSPSRINNTTFIDNDSIDVGVNTAASLYIDANSDIGNSVIGGSSIVDHCYLAQTLTSNGYNIESTDTCGFANTGDKPNTNPRLGALKTVGLNTRTTSKTESSMLHVPSETSPVIDAADNTSCAVKDQRDLDRPFDGDRNGSAICDIGAVEFNDFCPNDNTKQFPGVCGCGTADSDSDGDGAFDCNESCDNDPNKTSPGTCGCGVPEPGICGCGIADTDTDKDGTPDCKAGEQVATAAGSISARIAALKYTKKKKKRKALRAEINAIRSAATALQGLITANASNLVFVTNGDVGTLDGFFKTLNKQLRQARKNASKAKKKFNRSKKKAAAAATNIDAVKPGV